jgi:hypothetical protein
MWKTLSQRYGLCVVVTFFTISEMSLLNNWGDSSNGAAKQKILASFSKGNFFEEVAR